MSTVTYTDFSTDNNTTTLLVGRKARLEGATAQRDALGISEQTWAAMLESVSPGDAGSSASTWVGERRVVLGVTPDACSRHNSPSRAWSIPGLVRSAGSKDLNILILLDDDSHARAAATAASRSVPAFTRSTTSKPRTVQIAAYGSSFVADSTIQPTIDGVRLAARLFDTPADTLHTDAFVAEAQAVAEAVGAEISVISGSDLDEQGFGGLWGVGKAAVHGPALVTLKKTVPGATQTVAWVGKGIVYDTGGLSIKTKGGMPGMKGDMGGAAAVLGAFSAAGQIGCDHNLMAILCLAENSVGPDATRPDDVLTMRSGKTVEVNNTDAEGRLVLGDGVAWAAEQGADIIIDCATLTGAALVATGKIHAALYCNDEALEKAAVVAGRLAGEPCHPLPYAPELFRKEFRSAIADMKNSVKDRGNAQSSCAGQFVGNHLPDPAPRWLHIDLAGPAWGHNDRGTGFGVGLLLTLGAG